MECSRDGQGRPLVDFTVEQERRNLDLGQDVTEVGLRKGSCHDAGTHGTGLGHDDGELLGLFGGNEVREEPGDGLGHEAVWEKFSRLEGEPQPRFNLLGGERSAQPA